jgi:hypothetical protein
MMMRHLAIGCLIAWGLASGGCNAALGIEEAHERSSTSSLKNQSAPLSTCDGPLRSCGACVDSENATAACLGSHDCRKALDDYRQCLGSSCNREGCFTVLKASAGQAVAAVVAAECSDCADTSPLATTCDLYCACMEQKLPDTAGSSAAGKSCAVFDGGTLPWTLTGDASTDHLACKAACQKIDLVSLSCRWGHCELAQSGESATHCNHAVSEVNCPAHIALDANCTDRKLGGFACVLDGECCSGSCVNNFCSEF